MFKYVLAVMLALTPVAPYEPSVTRAVLTQSCTESLGTEEIGLGITVSKAICNCASQMIAYTKKQNVDAPFVVVQADGQLIAAAANFCLLKYRESPLKFLNLFVRYDV